MGREKYFPGSIFFLIFFLKLEKVQSYRYAFKVKPNYPCK